MRTKTTLYLLFAITFLAALLRLYKLNTIPPGVNRDEAAIGYTAYSLLKTGKDEYGRPWPISFQSFGDWKLPLYIYTTMPFVKVLGMNELAVRLPSAIAGTLTVFLTYFLIHELFRTKPLPSLDIGHWTLDIAGIATAMLAFSPWHIHLSRVESESNVAVFFTTLGLLLFLKGLRKNILLPPSAFFLALPYFTYHGNHITTTLLIAGLIIFFRRQIPRNRFSAFSFVILLALPAFILSQTLPHADKTKLAGISIFGDPAVIHANIELPRLASGNPNGILTRIRYNRLTYGVETVTRNYLASFGPAFLFLRGGTNRAHNIEGVGNLLLVEAPFFYLGILLLFLRRASNFKFQISNFKLFLLWWLLVAPLAASITKDAPHTNRMFPIYPLPPLLTAIGLTTFLNYIRNRGVPKVLTAVIAVALLGNVGYYLHQYFVNFPKNEARHWGLPYQKLTTFLLQKESRNQRIVISHPEYSPYIFLLFYSSYPPHQYQTTAVRYPPTADAFYHVKSFERFDFRTINWAEDVGKTSTLLVDFFEDIPLVIRSSANLAATITLPNGKPYLGVVSTESYEN